MRAVQWPVRAHVLALAHLRMVCCSCCPDSPPQQKKQKQARKPKQPKEKRTNEYGVTVRYSATPSQATYDRMQRALPGVLKRVVCTCLLPS